MSSAPAGSAARFCLPQRPARTSCCCPALLAGFHMSLFLLNLLPMLPFDGGYILGADIEHVRRCWARPAVRPTWVRWTSLG